jgi:hypothetical protein
VSRPGTGRRIDLRREMQYGDQPVAPLAARLIHANYADREIVLASGGVFRWGDSVGARDFEQADTGKDPVYGVFTTKPAVVFDGVDDFMLAPAVNLAPYSAVTVAMVFTSNAGGLQMLMETSTVYSSNAGAFSVALNGGTLNPSYYTGGAVQSRGPFAIATSGTFRLIFVMDTTAVGTITGCWLNGVSVGSTPAGASAAFGNHPTYIGMRAGTNFPYAGKMGDTLMYSGTMTAGEIAQIDAFLAARCV